jgi:hypothetical protein
MKKRVLLSAMLAGVLVLSGCESKNAPATPDDTETPAAVSDDVSIKIVNDSGDLVVDTTLDPVKGGTIIISRDNVNNTNNVANVVRAELKKCAEVDTSLVNTPGIACSPKEGVTYIFGSDYGKLGPDDNNISTPDGGVLLKYALTEFGGVKFVTPIEGNQDENRIQEVFIPSNYIRLNDAAIAADLSVDEKYELIKRELEDVCNMKCQSMENANNPFFANGVTTGKFVATYVMHFTRGTGEKLLLEQYAANNYDNLEYLTVSFEMDISKVGNSLKFTSEPGTPVVFGAKKHDSAGGGLVVVTENIDINSILHEDGVEDSDDSITINMAKYFNKLIAKGEHVGVADYAKAILVENATNPWPVKIYGTLHEITGTANPMATNADAAKRSYVRNPSNFDPHLFGLTQAGPYKGIYAEKSDNQAVKFNIVYPGGVYNKL